MTKIEKLMALIVDFFDTRARMYGEDPEEYLDMVLEIDFNSLYQRLARDMETVFACRAFGETVHLPQYYGNELFDCPATLLHRESDCSCDLHDDLESRHYYELWLLDDMTFAVTTCFQVIHDEAGYIVEYREYKGSEWPDVAARIDLDLLFDELAIFREADQENLGFVYIEA